jgi:hypothetical protein
VPKDGGKVKGKTSTSHLWILALQLKEGKKVLEIERLKLQE